VLTQATDLYKLGLFVLRVLSPGPQASTFRDPGRVMGKLDAEGRGLITAALGPVGSARPTAAAWSAYFAQRIVPAVARLTPRRVQSPGATTSGWRRDPMTGRWVPAR
jgi:hypothetical protein